MARDVLSLPAVSPATEPVHRFDDPERGFSVRYTAQDLETCLLESMQRFRPPMESVLAQRLAGITGVSAEDHQPNAQGGLQDWLRVQRVGLLKTLAPQLEVIDMAVALDTLLASPTVLQVLHRQFPDAKHPDMSHLLAGDWRGRAVTQALAAAIHSMTPRPCGIAYPSRWDIAKTCWAIFGDVPVVVVNDLPLSAANPMHREAVRAVSARYRIDLPDDW